MTIFAKQYLAICGHRHAINTNCGLRLLLPNTCIHVALRQLHSRMLQVITTALRSAIKGPLKLVWVRSTIADLLQYAS